MRQQFTRGIADRFIGAGNPIILSDRPQRLIMDGEMSPAQWQSEICDLYQSKINELGPLVPQREWTDWDTRLYMRAQGEVEQSEIGRAFWRATAAHEVVLDAYELPPPPSWEPEETADRFLSSGGISIRFPEWLTLEIHYRADVPNVH